MRNVVGTPLLCYMHGTEVGPVRKFSIVTREVESHAASPHRYSVRIPEIQRKDTLVCDTRTFARLVAPFLVTH
jgi:hypothetical protein